ncbi:GNAT family N-acetyltransferase [Altererythrobacter xixiisoli]|uniref:GNAT family N-acetyltransferase n=1 Tax=Croceibacterium xixiisoli TaxID=1476466 RepID=A0A6I4TN34_9SPHN|nr:GNAT family N-acetyltransferase [Croceibacterium xixiisoli]MXO97374.1 GNAT family N-acetyltransferase [Croceibacterium xixiisoli]
MAVNDLPVILTERLELRPPVPDDFAVTGRIIAHPETARFLGTRPGQSDQFLRFMRGAGSWLLYGYGPFTLRLRSSGEVIGNCGLFHSWRDLGADFDDVPEAGWILAHDQVGRGLAGEAMGAALDWFDRAHGPRRVTCLIEAGNVASLALAARLGFAAVRDAPLVGGDIIHLLDRGRP